MIFDKNKTSLAGEFYAMSWLFRKGFDATLTLGHTKGVDIILSKDNRLFKIEVKTTFGRPKVEKIFDGKLYS